jgi:membrane peptidoglycan carboxypeptidase
LPFEGGGIIPGREIKAKLNPRDPKWRDHDTVIASVGQGAVAVTPLQLLRAYAGLAMGGQYHTPHLFLRAGSTTQPVSYTADKPLTIPISHQTLDIVQQGLWGVVNEGGGTGGRARVVGFDVSGKTGTAQVVALDKTRGSFKDHAWFVAFAPREKPEIAVVVLVENVGFGGTHSAPLAGAVLDAYYKRHYGKPEQELQIAEGAEANESPEVPLTDSVTAAGTAALAATLDEAQSHPAPEKMERAATPGGKVKTTGTPRPAHTDVKDPPSAIRHSPSAVAPSRPTDVKRESGNTGSGSAPDKRRPKLANQQEPSKRNGATP